MRTFKNTWFYFAAVIALPATPVLACSENDVENMLAQCVTNAQTDSNVQIISGIWVQSLVETLQAEADDKISSTEARPRILEALKGCLRDDLWYEEVVQACGEAGTLDYIRNQFGLATQ